MDIFYKKRKSNGQKGFTLLFAILVSTLVLSISATVMSIALRQTIISGTSRESQYAFYATNTVLECAFYWDVIGVAGASGTVFPYGDEDPVIGDELSDITCAGGNITNGSGFTSGGFASSGWTPNSDGSTTIFIELKDRMGLRDKNNQVFGNTYCAQATISKTLNPNTGLTNTRIEAKGYNTCDMNHSRIVERGLIQTYQF